MAFTLEIVNEKGQLLTELRDVNRHQKISELRERLIGETAMPKDFKVLVSGIELRPKQEEKYTVDGVCGDLVQLQARFCNSDRRSNSPQPSTSSTYWDSPA